MSRWLKANYKREAEYHSRWIDKDGNEIPAMFYDARNEILYKSKKHFDEKLDGIPVKVSDIEEYMEKNHLYMPESEDAAIYDNNGDLIGDYVDRVVTTPNPRALDSQSSKFIQDLINMFKPKTIPEGDVRYIEDKDYESEDNFIYKKDIAEKDQAKEIYNYLIQHYSYTGMIEFLREPLGKEALETAVSQLQEYKDTYAGEEVYAYDTDDGKAIYNTAYHDEVYTRPAETFKYFCKLFYDREKI